MGEPPPAPRKWIWPALLLFIAALGWRLPYTVSVHTFFLDETAFAQPTIAEFLRGEYPIYLYSNSYMAPVQEWIAAGLVSLWGESLATLRLPAVFCGALAIVLLYRNLLQMVAAPAAFALCLPLVCTNSYTGIYTTFGIPSYAVATLCAVCLQSAAMALDRRRTLSAWLAFGVLGGFSAYVFKILVIQFGVALVWLLLRSRAWKACSAKIRADDALRRRTKIVLTCVGAALVALAPAAYRYLTRPDSYRLVSVDALGIALSVSCALAALLAARPLLCAQMGEWGRAVGCVTAAAATYLPPELYFSLRVKPRLLASGMTLWEGSRYSWKHAHEWPLQVELFLERVFATVLVGRVHELQGGYATHVDLGWRAVLSAAVLLILLVEATRRWLRGARPDWTATHWLFVAPFFVIIGLMLPSWQLNNDWCGRYLLPFQIGLYLSVYLLFGSSITRHPRRWAILLAAYVLYCGIDTYLHLPS